VAAQLVASQEGLSGLSEVLHLYLTSYLQFSADVKNV
jgi:hypothetical protein